MYLHFNRYWRVSITMFLVTVLTVAGVFFRVPYLKAQGVIEGLQSEVQSVLDRAKDSVVQVKVIIPVTASSGKEVNEGLSVGSGFFVDNEGHILTTQSVMRGSKEALVYWQKKTYEAQCVGQDERTNLALLKIDAKTTALSVGEDGEIKVGSIAFVVGYPFDGSVSAEYGFISDPHATRMPQFLTATHIRSNVRTQPGHSGSPLLNSKGQVIGVVVYAMDDGSSTFALPISAAHKIQSDLFQHHVARHGWTGLSVAMDSHPIRVIGVYDGSPAHVSGIMTGDVLRRIGDKKIETSADLMNATFYLRVDDTVNFTMERDKKENVFPVKILSRPSDTELIKRKLLSIGRLASKP